MSNDPVSYATLSSKGQVTVPKAIRDRLEVAPGDKVAFAVRDGVVVIEAGGEGVLSWYGSGAGGAAEDWAIVRSATMTVIAEETAEEGLDRSGPPDG